MPAKTGGCSENLRKTLDGTTAKKRWRCAAFVFSRSRFSCMLRSISIRVPAFGEVCNAQSVWFLGVGFAGGDGGVLRF
jgi:hypothetical protein